MEKVAGRLWLDKAIAVEMGTDTQICSGKNIEETVKLVVLSRYLEGKGCSVSAELSKV